MFITSTLDTALEILKVQYQDDKRIKVKAMLINRHNGIYYETETYTIQRDQLKYWKEVPKV